MARERQTTCPLCRQFVASNDGLTDSADYADESDAHLTESWHDCPNTSGLISAASEQRARGGE